MKSRRHGRRLCLLAAFAVCLLLLTACSSAAGNRTENEAENTLDQQETGRQETTSRPNTGAALPSASQGAASDRKVTESLLYEIETLDFEASVQALNQLCEELGGYVQESSVTGGGAVSEAYARQLRQASYTLRVPRSAVSQWKQGASGLGSILRQESSTEDVTDSYFDVEARLKSLRTKQERLTALLEQAQDLDDVLALEQELSQTNYEIEKLTGTLKKYDSLIEYSTVRVSLNEVREPSKRADDGSDSLGARIAQSFQQSMRSLGRFGEDLLVWLAGNIVILLLLAALAAAAVVGIRRSLRRRSALKSSKKPAELSEAPSKEEAAAKEEEKNHEK